MDKLLLVCLIMILYSCASNNLFEDVGKEQQYLIKDAAFLEKEPTLKEGDRITISIWEHENLSIGSANSVYSSNESTGRWLVIDGVGEVNLPKLGRVKIAGYTLKEASYFLEKQYTNHILNPIINLKILSHYVTVLGEIKNPGKYRIDNDRVLLIDMIGVVQGFSDYADTKNVKLIRKINDKMQTIEIDMTQFSSITTYNLQLQPEDIIYVPSKKSKNFDNRLQKITPIAALLSGLAVVLSLVLK